MVYQVGTDARQLSGRWTLAGDDEVVYSEALTRLPDILPDPAAVDPPRDQAHPSSLNGATLRDHEYR
jgi:hypothetical protein